MSFSSNRKAALDAALPIAQRASHARSCALHVAQKFRVSREDVITRVTQMSGISLHHLAGGEELAIAVDALERLRGFSAWTGLNTHGTDGTEDEAG